MDNDISQRLKELERINRVLVDAVADMSERIGDTLGKQVFSVKELMIRWNASNAYVREIVSFYKLGVLRGKHNKPKYPMSVMRSEVLRYEMSLITPPVQKASSAVPTTRTARGFNPHKQQLLNSIQVVRGVRRLGEKPCEQATVKSRERKNA
jgi:hypothetical protein